jgi:hypothetical protein
MQRFSNVLTANVNAGILAKRKDPNRIEEGDFDFPIQ